MSTFKHTPGPWRWWTSCSFNRLSSDSTGKDGDVLRGVKYSDGVCGVEGSEADMRLIAAAPLLLEALQKLVDSCADSDGAQYGTLGTSFVRSIATAAIAKATQEPQE